MASTLELYQQYKDKMQSIADVRNANGVLQWDQETYLPPKGAHFRGRQMSTLSQIAHQLFTDENLGTLLQELMGKEDLSQEQRRNVELTLEDYSKNKKYPTSFVKALSDQTNKAFHTWIEARHKNDFRVFEKDLEALIILKKEEAHLLSYEQHPYNALLNEYEKGATVGLLDNTFTTLLPSLQSLFQKIVARPQVDDSFLFQQYPKKEQWDWGLYLIKQLNFDFEAGRQDISEHPFSTSFNKYDVRITTRIDEQDLSNMTWSCIHETGHALYEQGLAEENYGLPLGEPCSYSIHESQSRLWENNIGRSFTFWQHYYPHFKSYFPEQLNSIDLKTFYQGINKVQPSLVRTEADEISYHFHVYIRYELEKRLIEGTLQASDIPQFWKEQYKQWLGISVTDDRQGCLQDVHWSHGSFGYFPTYSLGSFYAAQFYAAAKKQISGLQKEVAEGNTTRLLDWLRTNVHIKGRMYTSEELCRQITGGPLEINHFTDYLLEKYTSIYNL